MQLQISAQRENAIALGAIVDDANTGKKSDPQAGNHQSAQM
jgi:hypothetical protein